MFCKNCGAQIADNATFCNFCGAKVEIASQTYQQPQQTYQQPQQTYQQPQQSYQQPQQNFQQGYQQPAPPKDNRKLYSILAYIPFLWLLGLCSNPEKNDADVKFHVKQGIVTTIIYMALLTLAIIRCIIMFDSGTDGGLVFLAVCDYLFASAVGGVYCVFGIINAAKGQKKRLPIVEYFIKK